jgi:hypothetical protein
MGKRLKWIPFTLAAFGGIVLLALVYRSRPLKPVVHLPDGSRLWLEDVSFGSNRLVGGSWLRRNVYNLTGRAIQTKYFDPIIGRAFEQPMFHFRSNVITLHFLHRKSADGKPLLPRESLSGAGVVIELFDPAGNRLTQFGSAVTHYDTNTYYRGAMFDFDSTSEKPFRLIISPRDGTTTAPVEVLIPGPQ